jgi:quercetin dioxygenase-like cupin family protein
MIVKKLTDVPFADLRGYTHVTKQIVIGPDDGSDEIVLRYFSLEVGGTTPHHAHDFPHLVKAEAGEGVATDDAGREHPVRAGDFVFVPANERHYFRNTGVGPFEFVCIVPRRGEG